MAGDAADKAEAREAVDACKDEIRRLKEERQSLRAGLWSLGELGFEDASRLLRGDRKRRRGPQPGNKKSWCAVCFGVNLMFPVCSSASHSRLQETTELDSFTAFQCGHWLCAECAGELESDRCPVCRKRIVCRHPLFL